MVYARMGRDFALHVGRRIAADNIAGVAASLSYTSLLALVPLLSVSFAMLTAFPAFSGSRAFVMEFIFTTLMPASTPAVQQTLSSFVSATGKLTAIGSVGLAVTAVLLLSTIERAFNGIFRAAKGRSWRNRLLVYWTVLTLGPLLIGAAAALGGSVAAVTSDATALVGTQAGRWLGVANPRALWRDIWEAIAVLVPSLLIIASFSILYWAVPSCRVRTRDALLGAVWAMLVFAGLRFGFLLFFSKGGSYQTIYGALATVPLLLLWMYLSWLAILSGAVVTASLPEMRTFWAEQAKEAQGGQMPPQTQEPLVLATAALLSLEEAVPNGLSTAALLGRLYPEGGDSETEDIESLLQTLKEARLVVRDDAGEWHRTMTTEKATVRHLALAFGYGLPAGLLEGDHAEPLAWQQSLSRVLGDAQGAFEVKLSIPLAGLPEKLD